MGLRGRLGGLCCRWRRYRLRHRGFHGRLRLRRRKRLFCLSGRRLLSLYRRQLLLSSRSRARFFGFQFFFFFLGFLFVSQLRCQHAFGQNQAQIDLFVIGADRLKIIVRGQALFSLLVLIERLFFDLCLARAWRAAA